MTDTRPEAPLASRPVSAREGVGIPHDCELATDVSATGTVAAGSSERRLVGVDVARGLALVGMMAVHVLPLAGPDDGMSIPWVLAAGKAAALFAVLAGVGIAFGSGGRRRPSGRRRDAAAVSLVVRALMIGAVGLLLGYVVPADRAGVILAYYALLFVLAIPLLSLSTRALVAIAATIVVVMPVLSHLVRAALPAGAGANPTFTDLLTRPVELTTELALTGTYPALPWLAYVCVGLAVGRAALTSRGVVARIGILGVVIALAAGGGSWLVMNVAGGWRNLEATALLTMSAEDYTDLVVWGPSGSTPTTSPWWLGIMAPHSSTPFDLAFTIGTSVAVLAAAVLLGRVASRVLAPLAAAGSMTFTLYALHLLMVSSPVQPSSETLAFVLQLAVVLAFALLCSRRFSRGPLEAAVWRVTRHVRRRVMEARGGSAHTGSTPSAEAPTGSTPSADAPAGSPAAPAGEAPPARPAPEWSVGLAQARAERGATS
ncbi:heparan-alpha-glucosaminide N-acetyltransferase domain-containing protein [Georgenia faecalis]|uniref:heparan-alpha-glucosaminide N-acetyltransferase domain-containing protein n=1 Tax=Georgenia faecalis TaxID=2483799 RepID=UPI000FDACC04|nr:heparan-alpha-glucosaminide N-acetyltransferase domain-containing protein [Georgenia faecalis]